MSTNYNASSVGVPYARVKQVNIVNILNGPGGAASIPSVQLIQEMAVQLSDTSNVSIGPQTLQPEVDFTLDLVDNLTTPIPLVDPVTCIPTGQYTTLQQILAVLHAVAIQQLQTVNP